MDNLNLIEMMNEKLDELVARGIPHFQAKMIVAQAAVVMMDKMGVSAKDIKKVMKALAK